MQESDVVSCSVLLPLLHAGESSCASRTRPNVPSLGDLMALTRSRSRAPLCMSDDLRVCVQFVLRKRVLSGDMSKYRCCQVTWHSASRRPASLCSMLYRCVVMCAGLLQLLLFQSRMLL